MSENIRDLNRIFLHNIRKLYEKIPDEPGYEMFLQKYPDLYLNASSLTGEIGRNTFIEIFRGKTYKQFSLKTAIKALAIIHGFLSDEDAVKYAIDIDDPRKVYEEFTRKKFDEDIPCPKLKKNVTLRNYKKYFQDYFVYFRRTDSPLVHSGILSLYQTPESSEAYLLTYIVDDDLLRDIKTWNIFKDMDTIEEEYAKLFCSNGTNPSCRLYKSKRITFDPYSIRMELSGVGDYDGPEFSIMLDISKTYESYALYQGGLGISFRYSRKEGLHVSYIALLSCTNLTDTKPSESDSLLLDENGYRKKLDTMENVYKHPLALESVEKFFDSFKKDQNSDTFGYGPGMDHRFYTWIKRKNKSSIRNANTMKAVQEINDIVRQLNDLKDRLI